MKKQIIKLSFLMMVVLGTFTSCSSNETANAENSSAVVSEKEYYCPMKCEGEKTYKEPGKCPVCKMKLKEKE